MLVKVKNLHGTSDNLPSGFSSWKEFWKYYSGKSWPLYCSAHNCYEPAMVAGHVKLVDSYDNDWYLVPICYTHNNNHDEIFYVESSMLVKVNRR